MKQTTSEGDRTFKTASALMAASRDLEPARAILLALKIIRLFEELASYRKAAIQ